MDSWNLVGTYGLNILEKKDALKSLTNPDKDNYYDLVYDKNGNDPHWFKPTEGYWLSIKKAFADSDTI